MTTGRRWAVLVAIAAVVVAIVGPLPAARGQGIAYSWGWNDFGQLGNGTVVASPTPVQVTGLTSGVTSVSGGGAHSLALRNGAVFAWGNNLSGQLGNSTFTNSTTPVQVTGLTSGVTAVSAGFDHSLAIRNGAALAWGRNFEGQLGNGVPGNSNTPVQVVGLTSGVTAVSAGAGHSLAIQNGAAFAWGLNNQGQLGIGSPNPVNPTPAQVVGLTSGVTAVSAATFHSLAIRNGAAFAWGLNADGQLGNGTLTTSNIPVAVLGLTSGVTAISATGGHSLAVRNGAVFAWGVNTFGQLGIGSTTSSNMPTQVTGALAGLTIVQVTSGDGYSLALTDTQRLFAWGDNTSGQFGNGTTVSSLVPTEVFAPSGYRFTSLDGGSRHAVAVLTPVPEPGTIGVVVAGGLAVVGLWRRLAGRRANAGT